MAKGLLLLRGMLIDSVKGYLGTQGRGGKPRRPNSNDPYVVTDYVAADYVSETP
jgi:hypothetical protein